MNSTKMKIRSKIFLNSSNTVSSFQILGKLKWSLALHLLFFTLTNSAENSRSYDTNEWIPITPSTDEAKELPAKRATGRVLNLDSPNQQRFFPEDDHHFKKRRPHPQHFGGQKNRFNGPKYENEYDFVLPPIPQKGKCTQPFI